MFWFVYLFTLGYSHEEKLANCPYQFELDINVFIRVLIKVYLIMFAFRISFLEVRTMYFIKLEVMEQ